MKILVTGGAGFLGSNLVRQLHGEGHEVIVLDNFSTGDRANVEDLDVEIIRHDVVEPFRIDCDSIFHLACPASPPAYQANPARTVQTAVTGTFNALKCAGDVGAQILVASTSEVYGEPLNHPQSESDWAHINPVGDRSCYDAGKAAGESLVAAFIDEGLDARIVRIFNTYGPFMDPTDGRVVSNFVCQALTGEPLTVYGEGEQTRSFCYVDDLVGGMILAMFKEGCDQEVFNLGNPNEVTVKQVADMVLRLTDSDSEIVFRPLPSDDPTRRCPDISHIKDYTGWEPKVSLEEGLTQTIQYFEEIFAEPDEQEDEQ